MSKPKKYLPDAATLAIAVMFIALGFATLSQLLTTVPAFWVWGGFYLAFGISWLILYIRSTGAENQ